MGEAGTNTMDAAGKTEVNLLAVTVRLPDGVAASAGVVSADTTSAPANSRATNFPTGRGPGSGLEASRAATSRVADHGQLQHAGEHVGPAGRLRRPGVRAMGSPTVREPCP